MQKYRNAIFIKKIDSFKKCREVKLSTSFDNDNSLLKDINHFGYNQTVAILNHLRNALDGKYKYEYEWAGMRTSFESTQEKTIVEDMTAGTDRFELDTSIVYNIMNDRKDFMSSLSESDVLSKVKIGFESIKNSRDKYRLKGDRYSFLIDGIELNYLLFPSDIELDTGSFMSTISVNKSFLKPIALL